MTKQEAHEIKQKRINKQEDIDFDNTKKVFTEILNGDDVTFTQTALLAATDMRFEATSSSGHTRKFNVEIKTSNQDMDKYDNHLLKVSKFCDMREDTKPDEKLLYVVLSHDTEYFIYDLDKIDWNQVWCNNLYVNDYEFNPSEHQKKVKTPYFHLPYTQACTSGIIPK